MFRTSVNAKLLEHVRAKRVVREHALDDAHHRVDGVLLDLASAGDSADTARIERVAVDRLVLLVVAGQADLIGVDDDDVVATVYVRGELRLVLATEDLGRFSGLA